jgi:hypothetical protein
MLAFCNKVTVTQIKYMTGQLRHCVVDTNVSCPMEKVFLKISTWLRPAFYPCLFATVLLFIILMSGTLDGYNNVTIAITTVMLWNAGIGFIIFYYVVLETGKSNYIVRLFTQAFFTFWFSMLFLITLILSFKAVGYYVS